MGGNLSAVSQISGLSGLNGLSALGLLLPSLAYLIGSIVFGIVGFIAYRKGKKTSNRHLFWLGVALSIYPYFVSSTWLMYLIGTALCGLAWHVNRYQTDKPQTLEEEPELLKFPE